MSEHLGLFLDESRENLQQLNTSLLAMERDPADREALAATLRVTHSLKGMSATMGFAAIAGLTHRMEEILAGLRDGGIPTAAESTDILFACLDMLQEMVDRVAAGDESGVDTASLRRTLEAVAGVSELASHRVGVVATGDDAATPRAAAGPAGPPTAGHPGAATVRVGTDRLDALMDIMREMTVVRTRLDRLVAGDDQAGVRTAVVELGRVTAALQSLVMGVRMTRVETLFMLFPRMVRDLARTLGKRVDLRIVGEDTELDRAVIDKLCDPLVHMLRNAVDHGLEGPAERVAAGKTATGTVVLTARHTGGRLVIEVGDDGRGMDREVLRAAAVRKGMMDRQSAAALSDAETLELVMLPGFSTAATTTAISGRGVGMDAVRERILSLGGGIEIASTPGDGTTFTVRLPLTVALIGALLVRSGGETYAIQAEAIEEVVMVPAAEVRTAGEPPCLMLHDQIVPVVWLRDRPHVDDDGPARGDLEIVVVHSGAERAGVVVDGLIGQQDIVIRQLPDHREAAPGVAGAAVLGDGSVALIVDVAALVASPDTR